MIYLLIVIVLVVGVLLHSDTSTEITSSEEMSQDDLDMVKTEIDGFQSIVLTLRKKVQDVKGY
jgi:preprotein translocase subunit SecG